MAELIAHWELKENGRDSVGASHAVASGVSFVDGAATFNGPDAALRVEESPSLRLLGGDFTIAARIRCELPMRGVYADALSQFDPARRCGFTLSVGGSAPAYCGMSDTRHVHFGIDDGYVGPWQDHGRPWPSNSLVTCLLAFDGALYAGLASAAKAQDACHVFRWGGGQEWIDFGRLGDDPNHLSVQSMLVHEGRMYAGTGIWDWVRTRGVREGFPGAAPTRVFVYEDGQTWRDVGQVGNGSRVLCLGSYGGLLYAGLDDVGGGKAFRLEGDKWVDCGAPDGRNFECFMPLDGRFYGVTHGNMYLYDGGSKWTSIGQMPFNINQIHSLQVYGGRLWAGTWPQGYALRYEGGEWAIGGRLGIPEGLYECNEINDLTVHNGKLYAGVIPKAQVYRYESDGHWTLMGRLAGSTDWKDDVCETWCRVTSISSYGGRLFACTGSCVGTASDEPQPSGPPLKHDESLGRVHSVQTGLVVSHEHDIGGEWTHVAAVRAGKALRLYVNGRLSSEAQAPAGQMFDLIGRHPLLIGAGPQGTFRGVIADVRMYRGALTAEEVGGMSGGSTSP